MKNKESFLKELQNGLAVLAESEQQDILAEYAQHIDMRIGWGRHRGGGPSRTLATFIS